jgi:hypothetical protein
MIWLKLLSYLYVTSILFLPKYLLSGGMVNLDSIYDQISNFKLNVQPCPTPKKFHVNNSYAALLIHCFSLEDIPSWGAQSQFSW